MTVERPKCKNDGCNRLAEKANKGYRKLCNACRRPSRALSADRRKYRLALHLAETLPPCTACGFEAVHRCQLHIDHIDGDHKNNDPSNHQILCVNCHTLKTFLAKDYLPAKVKAAKRASAS